MKKLLAVLLCVLTLVSLLPAAVAEVETYRVESTMPKGYCYMYDRPTSTYGNNLRRYENGQTVQVCGVSGDFYCITEDGRNVIGYISCACLVRVTPTAQPTQQPTAQTYYIDSIDPYGYCYLYSQPSTIYGSNLGKLVDGQKVTMVNWNADADFAYVYSPELNREGYIKKSCLFRVGTAYFYDIVTLYNPRGYVYMYDQPSSVTGNNLAQYSNGVEVIVLNWNASTYYAQVNCQGKIGYIDKENLFYWL